MADHKATLKDIRSSAKRRELNRYQLKTTKSLIKKLTTIKDSGEAKKLLLTVSSQLDRLAKKNIIHKKNAANKKSKLPRWVNKLKKV